jgi:hypothetical protein
VVGGGRLAEALTRPAWDHRRLYGRLMGGSTPQRVRE